MRATHWYLCSLLAACGGSDPSGPACSDPQRGPLMARFADVTGASGVAFTYKATDFTGGALAVADLDGDGLPDIIAGRQVGGVMLFRNRGGLKFEQAIDSGLDATLAISAISAVDLDNDGDLDLVLAGPGTAYVMANHGDGTFEQVARFDDTGTTQHVLPVDLDGDGLLDLYFSNHDLVVSANALDRLYMNKGGLQFTAAGTMWPGQSWAATALDVDGDGDQDLYIANDTLLPDFGTPLANPGNVGQVDLLLRNDGPGPDGIPVFTDIAADMGLAQPRSSMGGVLGDFDADGLLDLYIPNEGAKKLFLRDPAGGFVDHAVDFGVAAIGRINTYCGPVPSTEACLLLTWSAAVSDFDLDGYDELLLVSGEAVTPGTAPPVVMLTRGPQLPYTEVSPGITCTEGRGVVVTDLDGDGDQDILIAQQEGPLLVYENQGTPVAGTWLRATLHGSASNRQGVGAVVTIHMTSGRTQTRVIGAGGVINSSSPAEAFFGLGSDPVASIEVLWSSGRRTGMTGPAAGSVVLEEGP